MPESNQQSVSVPDYEKVDRLVAVLRQADGGPLMVKEVAERMGVSANTAGKYVDIGEALELIVTDRYGSAKRVWLPETYAEETVGRGG